MRKIIQAIILYVLSPTIAASTYDNANYNSNKFIDLQTSKQISDASAPNFVRLVIMRLIYGIASTIGLEDRLEDTFNGAFVPPNAENDLGIADIGGGGEGILSNIFEDDDY